MSSLADALDAQADSLERSAAELRERARELRLTGPALVASPYLRVRDLAELLRVNERTVRRWRSEGVLPPAVEIAGVVRWRREAVEAWLAGRADQPSQVRAQAG